MQKAGAIPAFLIEGPDTIPTMLSQPERKSDDRANDKHNRQNKNRTALDAILVVNVRQTQERVNQVTHTILHVSYFVGARAACPGLDCAARLVGL